MSHNNNNSTVKHLFSVGQSWGFGNRVFVFVQPVVFSRFV